jgi:ATP-binding cassette subfamily G (WHITE) protein 2
VLNAHYTVYETLYYSTALRLSGELTREEQARRIEEVMQLMDITHCKDVLVGDSRVKGISGGERKRLSVAVELLPKPKMLFLDEPTSGLDSTSALKLVKIFRGLADRGECTVITTIHQPPSKVFALMDNLLLLRNGETVYMGSTSGSMAFFQTRGYQFPDDENPADRLVQIISFGTHDKATGAELPPAFILQPEQAVDLFVGEEQPPIQHRMQSPWHWQLLYLVQRNFLEQFRRKERFIVSMIAALIMGTFIGMGVWNDIGTYQNSIALSRPALYFVSVYQGVACCFLGSVTFPADRPLMLRERQAGTYYGKVTLLLLSCFV